MAIFEDKDPEYAGIYAEEAAMVDASELIAEALTKSGMSRSDLAAKLGVSKSEITARLAGERNITVRKLARTLHALGQRVELQIRESGSSAQSAGMHIVHLEAYKARCLSAQKHAETRPTVAQVRHAVGAGR